MHVEEGQCLTIKDPHNLENWADRKRLEWKDNAGQEDNTAYRRAQEPLLQVRD